MQKERILFIGVGDSGCKIAEELWMDGYHSLAIHANHNTAHKLHCPQLNLLNNHVRDNECPGFTENPDNVKLLAEENRQTIKDILHDYFYNE